MYRLLIILLILASCKKDTDGFREYTVKAGNHYSQHGAKLILSEYSVDAWFKVDKSWVFGEGVGGCSKIFGISLGHHLNNSARLGYRGFGEMTVGLWVHTPEYPDGYWMPIDSVKVGGVYHCRIAYERGYWVLRMGNREVSVKAGKKKDFGYILYPFAGGDYTLKHNWNVSLKFE